MKRIYVERNAQYNIRRLLYTMVLFCAPNARSTFYSNRNTNSKWHLKRTTNQLTDRNNVGPHFYSTYACCSFFERILFAYMSSFCMCVCVVCKWWFVHTKASTFELVQILTGSLPKMPLAGWLVLYKLNCKVLKERGNFILNVKILKLKYFFHLIKIIYL